MSPSHSRKERARYRYYVSSALIQGQPEAAGTMSRVPAVKLEAIVVEALRRHLGLETPMDNARLIATQVDRIVVKRTEIAIAGSSAPARHHCSRRFSRNSPHEV